ncbi:LysR family transcriptional regulator [Roseovarius sp.]|uniref:LysR family transcriptional regulator n=1 Tax=Roseovarius sp. TaxID=1486281 RepID=UPI003B59D5C3
MQEPDWEDIRLFLGIARTGSLVGAAKRLAMDHTTLSRRLTNLETRLGVKLFERAGRRLRINAAGQRLQQTAERMEANLITDMAALQTSLNAERGVVRIGAPEGLGIGYLAARMGGILDLHPGLEVELVALPQRYSLAAREADIVITLDRPTSGSLVVRKLVDYKLGFYASSRYLRNNKEPEHIQDLQDHRLCGYIGSLLHTRELDYLHFGDVHLTANLSSTSVIAQRDMILNGVSIGILPMFVAAGFEDELQLILKQHLLSRTYWMTIHEDFKEIERIRLVAQYLSRIMKEEKDIFTG